MQGSFASPAVLSVKSAARLQVMAGPVFSDVMVMRRPNSTAIFKQRTDMIQKALTSNK
jgi:hypothetical protein